LQIADMGVDYGTQRSNEIRQGVVNRAINDADSVLGLFFSPAEIKQLSSAASTQEVRRLMGVEAKGNIADWYNKFYSASNPRQAEEVFRRLSANPNTAGIPDTLRQMIRNDFWRSMTKEGSQGRGRIVDPDAVDEFLSNTGKKFPRLEWMISTGAVDPGFAARLSEISDAVRIAAPKYTNVNIPAPALEPGVFGALKRGAFFAFGMLNDKARTTRLAINAASDDVKARVARALFDPNYFSELMGRAERSYTGTVTAATLGGLLFREGPEAQREASTWANDWTGAMGAQVNRMRGE